MVARPRHSQILVVGGGPAGATTATLLARAGLDVTLVEREHFPRYHIGESLLPSALTFLDILGAREKVEAFGFQRKPGAHIEWGHQQWDLYFGELSGTNTYSFQVVRSEFDQCLLDHARDQGAKVFQGVEVRKLTFDEADPRRPVGAALAPADRPADAWEINFDYLVDASGRNGLMSTRYLENRYYHEVFKNVAVWGYWEDARPFTGEKEGAIATVSIPEGWIWAIPLHDGKLSVGVVLHKNILKERRGDGSIEDLYHAAIANSPTVSEMVASARLASPVQAETDYSYAADSFAGPGYFITGDAACFLDPLLSTGVHLAMLSGLLSASAIASLERNEVSETEAIDFYDKSYRRAYLRYLVFLSAFYNAYDGKDSIFWMAQQLSSHDAPSDNIKHAFTSLMSGVDDLQDIHDGNDVHQYVMREMVERVQENLEIRQDKDALHRANIDERKVEENGAFFDRVEGVSVLSPEDAAHGLYVVIDPQLGLKRVNGGPAPLTQTNGHAQTSPKDADIP